MSLHFSDHGETARVSINDIRVVMTDDEVTHTWCQVADLYDYNHEGPAKVIMGNQLVALNENEWQELYDRTSAFINKAFFADMLEEKTYH